MKKATVLIFALIILGLLSGLSVSIVFRGLWEYRNAERNLASAQAFWLAEAGVADALEEVEENGTFKNIAFTNLNLGYFHAGYQVEVNNSTKAYSTGSVSFFGAPINRTIELSLPFYGGNVLYVAGDISVSGTSNSLRGGDVIYAGNLSGTLNITNGRAYQDPSIYPLDLLDFEYLKNLSISQGNYNLSDNNFPTTFWYNNTTPNVVYLERSLDLSGTKEQVAGFYIVGGDVVYDAVISGNAGVDGCIYTRGNFTINGGGNTLNIKGGVWVGEDVTLHGGVELEYNRTYAEAIYKLGANKNVTISWREFLDNKTFSPYYLSN